MQTDNFGYLRVYWWIALISHCKDLVFYNEIVSFRFVDNSNVFFKANVCALSAVCFFHYIACLSFSLSHSFYLSLGSFHYIFSSDDNFCWRVVPMVCFHFNYTNIDVKPNQNKTEERKRQKERWFHANAMVKSVAVSMLPIFGQYMYILLQTTTTDRRATYCYDRCAHIHIECMLTFCISYFVHLLLYVFVFIFRLVFAILYKHFIPTLYLFQTKRIEAKSLLHT